VRSGAGSFSDVVLFRTDMGLSSFSSDGARAFGKIPGGIGMISGLWADAGIYVLWLIFHRS
jgi:hypothetical protein